MALALAVCALLLNAIVFNMWLKGPLSVFHSFVLEWCCPKYLKATHVQLISKCLMLIMAAAWCVTAYESSPCIPLVDINYQYFNIPWDSDASGMFRILHWTAASVVYYTLKLVTYAVLMVFGFAMMEDKQIRDDTTAFINKTRLQMTCPICQCEVEEASRVVRCVQNHPIHRGCLDSLIEHKCKTVLLVPSASSLIGCSICKAIFTHEQLTKGGGGTSKKLIDLLGKVNEADVALSKLDAEEQVKTGNSDCYMCPKCNFGPVAHVACADLSAHDNRKGISNKCPKCSFFADSISKWKKWNGGKAKAPQEDVIGKNEATVMDFCAVTLEIARDMLRRDSNVQRAITNFAQRAPTAHIAPASPRRPQEFSRSRRDSGGAATHE
jgi:LSD1 subclass zinc finger protein